LVRRDVARPLPVNQQQMEAFVDLDGEDPQIHLVARVCVAEGVSVDGQHRDILRTHGTATIEL
jgi:hypothetical protein